MSTPSTLHSCKVYDTIYLLLFISVVNYQPASGVLIHMALSIACYAFSKIALALHRLLLYVLYVQKIIEFVTRKNDRCYRQI